MNTPRKYTLLTVCMLIGCLLHACQASKSITIGTFNIEWLGDNTADDRKIRTGADDNLLRTVLRDANADILAVQEIENEQALQRLVVPSPQPDTSLQYRFILGSTGGKQRVGFLYRPSVELVWSREITSIAVETGRTRAGLLGLFRSGAASVLVMTVHLKASSRADSTPELAERAIQLRTAQAAELRRFADSLAKADSALPLIILGDFNDSPLKKRTAIDTLYRAPNLTFLTAEQQSCLLPGLPSIDHIVCNEQAMKRLLRGTLRSISLAAMFSEQDAKRVSDHCPVLVQIMVR